MKEYEGKANGGSTGFQPVKNEYHVIPYRTYAMVWIGLAVLTGVTIWVAGIPLGRFNVLAALLIATAKAGLVLFFFMHLLYETTLFRLLLPVALITLASIIGLTFFDFSFR
ncbi:MAG: cytochrome C oxidase subunit IV family protein [Armatimonadetes bacterium]|nr:cytochrome C oxidase subunit IV family protein [Armatimonadota bacterium]